MRAQPLREQVVYPKRGMQQPLLLWEVLGRKEEVGEAGTPTRGAVEWASAAALAPESHKSLELALEVHVFSRARNP